MSKKQIDCGTLRLCCDVCLDSLSDDKFPFTKANILELKHFLSMFGHSKKLYISDKCQFYKKRKT